MTITMENSDTRHLLPLPLPSMMGFFLQTSYISKT
jgi:hypothetical protein